MSPQSDEFWQRIFATVENLGNYSYYQLLGVEPAASFDDIKSAYFRLARAIHPDRHVREPDPNRQRALVRAYARIGEAYRVLSNADQRRDYDGVLDGGKQRLESTTASASHQLTETRDPRSESARQMLARALQYLDDDEPKKARAQIQLAAQLEPGSPAIKRALEELNDLDRRVHARFDLQQTIEVMCATWDQYEAVYIHDLSHGGMFIRSRNPVAVGESLDVRIVLPTGGDVRIPVQVRHNRAKRSKEGPAGFGVKFVRMDDAQLDKLRRLMPREADRPSSAAAGSIDVDALVAQGRQELSAGNYEQACALFGKAIVGRPDAAELRAMYHLCSGYLAKQRHDDTSAREQFEAALRFDRNLTPAAFELRELTNKG